MTDHKLYVTDTDDLLLRVYDDGTREVAVRDEHRRWLPAHELPPVPAEVLAAEMLAWMGAEVTR